jgi:hypothetical protein
MKGRLIKVNDDWFIDYIFGDWQTLLPVVGVFDGLNPGDEVEFEITSKYEGYDIPVIAILKK